MTKTAKKNVNNKAQDEKTLKTTKTMIETKPDVSRRVNQSRGLPKSKHLLAARNSKAIKGPRGEYSPVRARTVRVSLHFSGIEQILCVLLNIDDI